MNYYDRYGKFRINGEMKPIPGIKIPTESSDKSLIFKKGINRMDKISDEYYGNPYCGFLVMAANQEFGGLEFYIPDMSLIRIPFPFESAVNRYIKEIQNYKTLYGGN